MGHTLGDIYGTEWSKMNSLTLEIHQFITCSSSIFQCPLFFTLLPSRTNRCQVRKEKHRLADHSLAEHMENERLEQQELFWECWVVDGFSQDYTPEGDTFFKPSFWVSMLVFSFKGCKMASWKFTFCFWRCVFIHAFFSIVVYIVSFGGCK